MFGWLRTREPVPLAKNCHNCYFHEYRPASVQTTRYILPDWEAKAAEQSLTAPILSFAHLICRRSNIEVERRPSDWCGEFKAIEQHRVPESPSKPQIGHGLYNPMDF